MNKFALTIIAIVLILSTSAAQENKVIRKVIQKYSDIEDKILPYSKVLYQYDKNNNETNVQKFYWDNDSLKYHLEFTSSKTYSPTNKILTQKSHYTPYHETSNTTYEYDQSDSLSFSSQITSDESYSKKTLKFYTSAQIDSIYWYYLSPQNIWELQEKKYFTYSGNKTSTSRFFYSSSDSTWTEIGETIIIIDTIQNSRSYWTNISDFAQEEMWITYFDEHISQYFIKPFQSTEFELTSETITSITNNSFSLPIEIISVTNAYDNGQIWLTSHSKSNYDYYCDNILKEERKSYNDKLNLITTYYYQKGTNCNQEMEPTINISPNPFHDYIDLTGTALEYEDVSINIYNSIGQNIFSKSLSERTNSYHIKLPHLSKGIYLATFQWNKHTPVSKKLVKN